MGFLRPNQAFNSAPAATVFHAISCSIILVFISRPAYGRAGQLHSLSISMHSIVSRAKAIQSVCDLLLKGCRENTKDVLQVEYPFSHLNLEQRSYTPNESMSVFVRDGFIDRYSGSPLVFPGTLRLIHTLLPTEFPFHPNWKMSETHIAFWELFPTIDHVVPVARGGHDSFDNWVSTSQLRYSAKSNWLLEELGWQLFPAGDVSNWDGLTSWFFEYLTRSPEHLSIPYISKWHKAAQAYSLPNHVFNPDSDTTAL